MPWHTCRRRCPSSTTDGEGGRCGITASAVCSVTDTPPTILSASIAAAPCMTCSRRTAGCASTSLSDELEQLAMHFSGATKVPMEERFGWDIWEEPGELGQPVLADALVKLQDASANSRKRVRTR
jgi:flavin reductase (NADH)